MRIIEDKTSLDLLYVSVSVARVYLTSMLHRRRINTEEKAKVVAK